MILSDNRNMHWSIFWPNTTELDAFGCLKNCVFTFFSVAIDKLLLKLVCNEDKLNILNEFKFQLDRTTDCGVSCH